MDRKYWEKNRLPGTSEEIFDVLQNDLKGIIRSAIRKTSSTSKTVLDAGCAVGKWLPLLSPLFKTVIATDISAKEFDNCKKIHPHLANVEYQRLDLSRNGIKLPKTDVVICINAILTDLLKKRNVFFHNISRCLNKNGYLVLVVPSLESWLLTRIIQNKWKIDRDLFNEKLSGKQAIKRYKNIQQGNAGNRAVLLPNIIYAMNYHCFWLTKDFSYTIVRRLNTTGKQNSENRRHGWRNRGRGIGWCLLS